MSGLAAGGGKRGVEGHPGGGGQLQLRALSNGLASRPLAVSGSRLPLDQFGRRDGQWRGDQSRGGRWSSHRSVDWPGGW
eukprot:1179794-Prorocentrum_minimum.AAC.1